MNEADVLIVGAGPAGSATAWHLARAGVRVRLLERARFPREKPCSEYLSPEAARLLAGLGALDELDRAGAQPLHGTMVVGPNGSRLTGRFARAAVRPFRDHGLAVARRVLDDTLARRAVEAGARLEEEAVVEELRYDRGAVAGAVVRRRGGRREAVPARLVIGADGLRSVVARRLGSIRTGYPARLAFVAHVAGVPGLEGIAEMHVTRGGYVGLNRIGEDLANVAVVVPREAARAAAGDPTGFFLDFLASVPGVAGRVRRERIVREVLATGPFARRAGRVTAAGALLVGDAADFFDPFTGEGITTALRGAELAARTALAALATPGPVAARRLAPYLHARRRAFLGKWMVERLVGYGMAWPAMFDRAVDRLGRRGLADTFIGVTADFVPARMVLNPWFLSRMVW